LRIGEAQHQPAARIEADAAGGVGLAVARLRGGRAGGGRVAGDPAQVVGHQRRALQQRVVMALHRDQRVAGDVLGRHEPRRVLAAAARGALLLHAADAQPLALAQRVEAQAHVLAQLAAALVLDGTGLVRQVFVQELAEGPLADEADAGRVLLLRIRQRDLGGDASHLGLGQVADREH
jgi:hypothetical protein